MTRSLRLLALLALVAACGCKQGQGERCQVTTDCQDNLVCIIPSGGSLAGGGTCQPQSGLPDGGAGPDLAGPDLTTGDGPVTMGEDLAGQDLSAPDMTMSADLWMPDLVQQD
jgi:hypothetical protein